MGTLGQKIQFERDRGWYHRDRKAPELSQKIGQSEGRIHLASRLMRHVLTGSMHLCNVSEETVVGHTEYLTLSLRA